MSNAGWRAAYEFMRAWEAEMAAFAGPGGELEHDVLEPIEVLASAGPNWVPSPELDAVLLRRFGGERGSGGDG